MRLIAQIGEWFDRRLQLAAPSAKFPSIRAEEHGQLVVCVGSAASSYSFCNSPRNYAGINLCPLRQRSVEQSAELNHDVTLGWFIRALHGWGSNFMVAIVLIHMVQVFLFGAFKFPRELTWVIGVFLLLMTLAWPLPDKSSFRSRRVLGLGLGASIASRVPFLGPAIVKLMLGGPIIGGATLSRFFALHVFVIPGMLIGFVGLHLLMVIKLGINEWPMPGRLVKKATYEHDYTN